jgi:hypothetical protein
MNLHNTVRGAITAVNADKTITLFRSLGTFSRDYNTMQTVPNVREGVHVLGQIQSIKPDDILHAEKISVSDIVRRIYLYAEEDPSERVQALYRPLAKAGDYLLDHLNRQWQVDAILEDFSAEGWVSVQAIMQPIPQTLIIVPDEGVTNGDN